MKQRTLTGVVLALLSMVLLGCFHLPWVPQLIAILLGCGAVWEILGANGIRNKGSYAAGLFLAVIIPLFSLTEKVWWMAAALVLGLGFFTYLMTRIGKQAPAWVAAPEIVLALSLYRGLDRAHLRLDRHLRLSGWQPLRPPQAGPQGQPR